MGCHSDLGTKKFVRGQGFCTYKKGRGYRNRQLFTRFSDVGTIVPNPPNVNTICFMFYNFSFRLDIF